MSIYRNDSHIITIQAPSTIANLVCGFDILGMAVTSPSDILTLTRVSQPGITLHHEDDFGLPIEPEKNIVGVVLAAAQRQFPMSGGLHARVRKAVQPGSGLGSSASSAAAAAYAYCTLYIGSMQTNQSLQITNKSEIQMIEKSIPSDFDTGEVVHFQSNLLNSPGSPIGQKENETNERITKNRSKATQTYYSPKIPTLYDVLDLALQGEEFASGSRHADNVAPCIWGGITLLSPEMPLKITQLRIPELFVAILLPKLIIKTSQARQVLPREVTLQTAIRQMGFLAQFVAALEQNNYELLASSLRDEIAEPYRQRLIPGFSEVMQAGRNAGALGGGIAGSGPAMFMLVRDESNAHLVAVAMERAFRVGQLECSAWVSQICKKGICATDWSPVLKED